MAALTLAACSQDDDGGSLGLTGGWQLVSGVDNGKQLEPIDSHPVTIEFTDDTYGGTAACNHYGGVYSLAGSSIELGLADITEMACEPATTMELESAYIEAVDKVDEVEVEGGRLKLTGHGAELVFSSLAPPQTQNLLGTVWVLDGLIEGELVASTSGDRATLEFFSDGSFIANTGCRNLTGTFDETASGIVTTNMTVSGECTAELELQDSRVVTVLEGSFRIAIEGDQLTLTIPGNEGLAYVAER